MKTETFAATINNRPMISTQDLAVLLALRPQSIRKRYCQTGAYFSLRPVKMPNGRLLWPADAIEQLQNGNSMKEAA